MYLVSVLPPKYSGVSQTRDKVVLEVLMIKFLGFDGDSARKRIICGLL